MPFQPSQIVQSDSEVWSSAQSRPRRRRIVQSSPVWLRTEQVVCDSRHELTSKDPQRGSKGDAGRQNGKREGETERVQKGIKKKKECRERREDWEMESTMADTKQKKMPKRKWSGKWRLLGGSGMLAVWVWQRVRCLSPDQQLVCFTLVNTNCSALIKVSYKSRKKSSPKHNVSLYRSPLSFSTISLWI